MKTPWRRFSLWHCVVDLVALSYLALFGVTFVAPFRSTSMTLSTSLEVSLVCLVVLWVLALIYLIKDLIKELSLLKKE